MHEYCKYINICLIYVCKTLSCKHHKYKNAILQHSPYVSHVLARIIVAKPDVEEEPL